jgi:hypothetical protein
MKKIFVAILCTLLISLQPVKSMDTSIDMTNPPPSQVLALVAAAIGGSGLVDCMKQYFYTVEKWVNTEKPQQDIKAPYFFGSYQLFGMALSLGGTLYNMMSPASPSVKGVTVLFGTIIPFCAFSNMVYEINYLALQKRETRGARLI